jgi:hypothetical protein
MKEKTKANGKVRVAGLTPNLETRIQPILEIAAPLVSL